MSKTTPKLLLIEKASACAPLLLPGVFEVVRAEHLAAGLEKLNAHAYDLILMDLVWPDSQGLIAFNQIHAATPQTPVIVLAEAAEEEIAARTIALGAQDYLLKSQLTAPALNAAVRKALDRHYFQLSHNHEGFLLQTLMNSIPDAVYFKDTRSRFLMISRALAKKHHLADPQQAVGKCDADYFTKRTRNRPWPTSRPSCAPASRWKGSRKVRPGRTAASPGSPPPRCRCGIPPAG